MDAEAYDAFEKAVKLSDECCDEAHTLALSGNIGGAVAALLYAIESLKSAVQIVVARGKV